MSTPRRQVRRPGDPRPHTHKVRVSSEVERRLLELAGERNITVVRLLVEAALAGGAGQAQVRAEMVSELYRQSRVLGRIGVLINQVAKRANTVHEIPSNFEPALAELRQLLAEMRVLVDVEDEASA